MASPRAARVTAPRRATAPERRRRSTALTVVTGGDKGRARRSVTGVAVVLATVVIFASLLGLAVFHTLLVESQSTLDRIDEQIADARARTDDLRLEVAELESPDRIVNAAREDLGMVSPAEIILLTPADPQASVPADPGPTAPEPEGSSAQAPEAGSPQPSHTHPPGEPAEGAGD